MNEDRDAVQATPLWYYRLAVRDDAGAWRWFASAIPLRLFAVVAYLAEQERQARAALTAYPITACVWIQAPTVAAYDLMDWADIERVWHMHQRQQAAQVSQRTAHTESL